MYLIKVGLSGQLRATKKTTPPEYVLAGFCCLMFNFAIINAEVRPLLLLSITVIIW